MANSDGSSTWAGRLVPVPLWYLLAGGAGFVADNAVEAVTDTPTAQASPVADVQVDDSFRGEVRQIARDVSDLKSSVAQIEGRLTSVVRSVAELQQDVKSIKLAIR